jgi:hypothetical protein
VDGYIRAALAATFVQRPKDRRVELPAGIFPVGQAQNNSIHFIALYGFQLSQEES